MKKTKQAVFCFLLILSLAFIAACTKPDDGKGTTGSTIAATESDGGMGTGPTNSTTNYRESTGVLEGIGNGIKDGAEDIGSGARDLMDGTSAYDSSAARDTTGSR